MLAIGSVVVGFRQPRDLDLVGTYDELQWLTAQHRRAYPGALSIPLSPKKTALVCDKRQPIEFEIAWPGSTGSQLLDHAPTAFPVSVIPTDVNAHAVTLNVAYTLKMSHRYLRNSPHFHKTRSDILIMRKMGARIWDADWLKRRERETYQYQHPKLDATKDDFFKVGAGSSVKYIFDHDSIHEAVSRFVDQTESPETLDGAPAYTLYKGDDEVMCDRSKFEALPLSTRIRGVLEEAYVLALERSQIPYGCHYSFAHDHEAISPFIEETRRAWGIGDRSARSPSPLTPRLSFEVALGKVCTSITSGWFREFAWEHYDEVAARFNAEYATHFWREAYRCRVKANRPPKVTT